MRLLDSVCPYRNTEHLQQDLERRGQGLDYGVLRNNRIQSRRVLSSGFRRDLRRIAQNGSRNTFE